MDEGGGTREDEKEWRAIPRPDGLNERETVIIFCNIFWNLEPPPPPTTPCAYTFWIPEKPWSWVLEQLSYSLHLRSY